MGRLAVQTCLATDSVRQHGTRPTFDLLGVEYRRYVPADTESPQHVGKLELFVRFFTAQPKPIRVLVTVVYLDAVVPTRVYRKRFGVARPADGGTVVDCGLKLVNLLLPG